MRINIIYHDKCPKCGHDKWHTDFGNLLFGQCNKCGHIWQTIEKEKQGEWMYKEFKIFKILFAITKIGIRIITENGNYGFNIDKLGFDIYERFSTKCFYWDNLFTMSELKRLVGME